MYLNLQLKNSILISYHTFHILAANFSNTPDCFASCDIQWHHKIIEIPETHLHRCAFFEMDFNGMTQTLWKNKCATLNHFTWKIHRKTFPLEVIWRNARDKMWIGHGYLWHQEWPLIPFLQKLRDFSSSNSSIANHFHLS